MSRLTKFKIERAFFSLLLPRSLAPSLSRSPGAHPPAAFRHPLKLDPEYPDKTWQLLENAIQEINADRSSGLSFEELHRNAYNMVVRRCCALCFTLPSSPPSAPFT